MRKITRLIVEGKRNKKSTVSADDITGFLGVEKYTHQLGEEKDQIGVTTGLAWTPVGGELLPIEVSRMPGRGKIIMTGQLGDVMRESAQAALSYARSYAGNHGVRVDMSKEDLHIHLPSGAIKKDGPSAGIALTSALISLFMGWPAYREIAMTGEVTLRGKVTEIGGLKEKVLAALRGGLKTVIIPASNKRDMTDLPAEVKKKLKFIFVSTMDDVVKVALKKNKK
jgi:ATP-dependent Lon protease